MNERQRRFAEYYATSLNATDAAIQAGYSRHSAYSSGQRLLKKAEIQEYLTGLTCGGTSDRIAAAENIRRFWSEVMSNTGEKISIRLKASELLAKSYGMFTVIESINGKETRISSDSDVVIYLPKLDELPDEDAAE